MAKLEVDLGNADADNPGGKHWLAVSNMTERRMAIYKKHRDAYYVKQKKAKDATTFRTLYVRRDVLNADAIKAWAKSQGFDKVVDDLHVTVMFSRRPVDWITMGEDWTQQEGDPNRNLVVPPSNLRVLERFGQGAVVLVFSNRRLEWRHESMRERGCSWDWPDYQPHITITYQSPIDFDLRSVESYKGEIVLGPEIYEEVNESWKSTVVES